MVVLGGDENIGIEGIELGRPGFGVRLCILTQGGGIGSSRSGRLNALMSTSSYSASVRFFAICNLIDPLGDRFAVAARPRAPQDNGHFDHGSPSSNKPNSLQSDIKEPPFI